MMVTRQEPFNAERLLLSTGIVFYNMESNWENGRYPILTPHRNAVYEHGLPYDTDYSLTKESDHQTFPIYGFRRSLSRGCSVKEAFAMFYLSQETSI